MSNLLYALMIAAFVLPIVNCGGSQHDPAETYYLVTTNIKLPYWQHAGSGLVRSANQLKVQAELVGPESYDPQGQRTEFQRIVARKPAGILVSVADPNVLQGDIDAAIGQGIPVITIDSDAPGSKRLLFIGTDNYKAGVMGAEIAVKHLQGKGNVAVYTILGQGNLNDRLRGYQDVFDRHPGIKITETVDMRGDPTVAFDKTSELVEKGTQIDAFVCLEAIACPEVAEVLDRKRVKGKIVVAMDTDQRTLEGIQQGVISATIAQKPFTMAFTGIKMLDDLHHHPPSSLGADFSKDSMAPVPMFVDTGATLIDKGNVDQFIQASKSATPAQ